MFSRASLLIFLAVSLAAPVAMGAEANDSPGQVSAGESAAGLTILDWAIIAAYAISTLGLGWWIGRSQSTTKEYFVGSGKMNPLLIGVSLFATLLSTITYLSMPGEVLGKGPIYLTNLLAYPLIFWVVGYIILPAFMKRRVTSAYELLERRLGLSVRMLGVAMFLMLRLVWMSLLIYLAAKAMTVMLGVDEGWIPLIVIVTGSVSVVYTTLGRLRAVVITDLIQTLLLFGGAILVLVMVTIDFGGFGWFPTEWHNNWDTQPIFSFDPQTRVTVVGTIITVFVWYVCTAAGDQVSIQRFMATTDIRAARRALATQLSVAAVVNIVLALVGLSLLGYFQAHVEALPASMHLKTHADQVFPHFIAFHLPPGVSGLVVAAMFAAAMSSIDSGVNSITAVVMTDLLDRFGNKPKTERGHMFAAQLLAFTVGLLVIIGSSFIGNIEGNITKVTSKTVNFLVTPIFALFFFAFFVRCARPAGVWIGAICGIATAAVVAYSAAIVIFLWTTFQIDPAIFGVSILPYLDLEGIKHLAVVNPLVLDHEKPVDPISFQWIGPIALAVNIFTGWTVSWLLTRCNPSARASGETAE